MAVKHEIGCVCSKCNPKILPEFDENHLKTINGTIWQLASVKLDENNVIWMLCQNLDKTKVVRMRYEMWDMGKTAYLPNGD